MTVAVQGVNASKLNMSLDQYKMGINMGRDATKLFKNGCKINILLVLFFQWLRDGMVIQVWNVLNIQNVVPYKGSSLFSHNLFARVTMTKNKHPQHAQV